MQSMLQDNAVSDVQLAEALLRLNAEELYWLASALLSTSDPPLPDQSAALEIVLYVLSQVVVHRERLWEHSSLRAWLARLTIQQCRRWERRIRIRQSLGGRINLSEMENVTNPDADSPPIQAAWQRMVRREQITLLLSEGLGFSQAEIAYVLDIDPYLVEYWLKESRLKIAASQNRQLAPGLSPFTRNVEGESSVAAVLRNFLPQPRLFHEQTDYLSAEIASRVQKTHNRRRAAITLREMVLLSLVLGILFFFCRAGSLLPSEIIHRYRTPTPQDKIAIPMNRPTPKAAFYYNYYAQPGDTLESIAHRARVKTADIITLNPFNHLPGRGFIIDPGAALRIPAGPGLDWRVTPIPILPAQFLPPLTVRSDIQSVLERIQNHSQYWHTLWMNIQEDTYGPPGYLGPPLQRTLWQVWIGPSTRAKAVIKWSNAPAEVLYSKYLYADGVYISIDDNGEFRGQYLETRYSDLFMPLQAPLEPQLHLRILREDSIAGRPTIVVDAQSQDGGNPSRIWVDAVTGVILRRITFSAQVPEVAVQEKRVTTIFYDQNIPASVFNPDELRSSGFSTDFRGHPLPDGQDFPTQAPDPANGHARLSFQPRPPGFDPSRQPIFLQWPEGWFFDTRIPKESSANNTLTSAVSVLASRYFLGDLPLENVLFHSCQRSPDGRLIALSVGSGQAVFTSSSLYWFALENPQDLHMVAELGYWGNIYAFSPDSQRLALFGCDNLGVCRLQSLDLATDALTEIDTRGHFPYALSWSPDSRFLVLVVEAHTATTDYALEVLEVNSGEEIYFTPFDLQTGVLPPDSPTLQWDIPIPSFDQMEMGCMNP